MRIRASSIVLLFLVMQFFSSCVFGVLIVLAGPC